MGTPGISTDSPKASDSGAALEWVHLDFMGASLSGPGKTEPSLKRDRIAYW